MSRRPNRRWTIRSISVFKHYMKYPGRGQAFSVRTLADESGVSPALIGKLLTGEQDNVDVDDAIALVEAVGSAINPLFAPPPSLNLNRSSPPSHPTSEE